MKYLYSLLILFPLAVILSGCPYCSPYALDETVTNPITSQLLGTWQKKSYPKDSTSVTFIKKAEGLYDIDVNYTDGVSEFYDRHNFIGFFSKINNGYLLNAFDTAEKKYIFIDIDLSGHKLTLRPISEDITKEQFTSSAQLRTFLEGLFSRGAVTYDTDSEITDLVKVK